MRTITRQILIPFFLIIISVSAAIGRDYTVRRKIDGHIVDVSINRNPPILGTNTIRIDIKDPSGKDAVNVQVSVNYFMPPMPGMPPMNYTVQALPSGSGYEAKMDFIMTGPWNIVVRANTAGKPLRMTVPIDVR